MRQKRAFVNFILATALLAGLFVSPIQSRDARAAPPVDYYVEIHYITAPPKTMCVGDMAWVVFSYQIGYYTKNTKETVVPGQEGSISITAKTEGGTIDPSSWSLAGGKGSGTIAASYKAKTEGKGQVWLVPSVFNEGKTAVDFDVVVCDWSIYMAAYDSVYAGDTSFYQDLLGDGGIAIDKSSGKATGGGTFRYGIIIEPGLKVPGLTCDKIVESPNNFSTFDIIDGTYMGQSFVFGIQFTPFEVPPIMARCIDKKGIETKKEVFKGTKIDLNEQLDLKKLFFLRGETKKRFDFGKKHGWIVLEKRKKGK